VSGANAEVLIENGFEKGNRDDSGPVGGWIARTSGKDDAASVYIRDGVAGGEVHSGSRAVAIVNPRGNVERWYLLNNFVPKASAGETYEFSAWVKTEQMAGTRVYLVLEWLDAQKTYPSLKSVESEIITEDQGWARVSVSGEAPDNAASVRPILMVDGSSRSRAVVTFDDVELIRK
jgi:hypothetical protein